MKRSRRKRINSAEKSTDEEIDMQIQKLQEEKTELKNKLKKIEQNQDQQMKKLCDLIGISEDVEGIINETNQQEIEKINLRKESLTKVEIQVKRSLELQKKIEENKSLLERIRKAEYVQQENHTKKIIDLKDHLQRLKDELLTIQFNSKYYEQEKIDAKSDELLKMVENSKNLIKEKNIIVRKLPSTLNPMSHSANLEELKQIGKKETKELYRKRFTDQKKTHQEELQFAILKKTQIIAEKQEVLQKMVNNFKTARGEKKKKLKAVSEEIIRLHDLVLSQKKVITGIQKGKFNQSLKAVFVPQEKIPVLPDKERFEE